MRKKTEDKGGRPIPNSAAALSYPAGPDLPSYRLIRSYRRTISLEVTPNLEIIVRAPRFASKASIDAFVASRRDWIRKALERQKNRPQRPELTPEELRILKEKARLYLPEKVAHYAGLMGLTPENGPLYPTGLKITSAKTRWGSCSPKNSLCFSCRLMQYPEAAIDYVIVHELAHIYHKNHGPAFYKCVETYLPDYKARRSLLKEPRSCPQDTEI
ncbi:MAG: M48 family metallopeptidase [Clostridiales bacterium]|nr:M48 family metallopeptidase [Clostridiales bacterium]